ncbi:hypothetical protein Poli38472_007964 [Pythium oligandrum]|uniref:AGC protein kinase n=1 Tax=Pythium oligandrum TaxID=41045 RepID=A0A8K1CMY8_PYTOL|nr:hypothetical protein Poli38472_007964 [Pythium oligandrum]|eukprot:TMW65322.1 hypothetical protein Poli38472_007964 [Pythium oligandrum]
MATALQVALAEATSTTSTTSKKRALSPVAMADSPTSVTCALPMTPALLDPHDLVLLKVIGRGTFAQQVALARHRGTQDMYVVKTLDKQRLIRRKQVTHTLTEKKVLEDFAGEHPFIVKLHAAFQTETDLHFVFEYCQGGELFFHLQQQDDQRFTPHATLFYAAEVLAALQALHAKGIVYRDLKPENVLLDAEGHIKLADFGFAKEDMREGRRTFSFCGSPEYLSPEMVAQNGHGMETDMWSFGCFCYELFTGSPPFQNDNLRRLFDIIQEGRVWYPSTMPPVLVSLLQGLLCVNPQRRFTAEQAMKHAYFQSMDWDDLLQRQVAPPIVPICTGVDCTFNFDDGFTREPVQSLDLDALCKKQQQQPVQSSSSSGEWSKRSRPNSFESPEGPSLTRTASAPDVFLGF